MAEQQRLAVRAEALSCARIPAHSYAFEETRQLQNGACVGRLDYPNPWLRVELALRVAPDWYLTLEHSGLGAWTLGGFHAAHHYQFRALTANELPDRAALFLDWALALKARHFDSQAREI